MMHPLLAILMNDGLESWIVILGEHVLPADCVLILITLVWLCFACLTRKKGQPMYLPPRFWYFAGPAIGGILFLIVFAVFAMVL
jgi:hypothetical protein